MSADICVEVAKYSHAIGENPDRTVPWIHHTASNMSLVLKDEDTHYHNGRLCMQIVQGNAALETINVGELVDKSMEVRTTFQRAGTLPQIEQLPIFGIHKDIYLAFRYRPSDGQARRVQLKLKSAHDCASMIEILQRRGMEFQQQRPHTSRLSTARVGTSSSQERPLTVEASHSANRAFVAPQGPIKPSPIRMPVLEAGGLSSQHSQHFGNTEGSFAFQRPPQKQSLLQFPAQSISLQELMHSFATHDTENHMPAPDFSRSNTAPFHGSMDNAATGYSDTSSNMHLTATATSSHGLDKPVKEHLDQSNAQLQTRDTASSFTENRSSLYRPSLPPSLRMPETLEHEMPPRRELPFKRPGSHQSSSSRPSTTSKSVYYNATGGSSDPPKTSSASSPVRKSNANRPGTAASVKSAAASKSSQPLEKAQAIHARPQSHASPLRKTSSGKTSAKVTKPAAPQSTLRRPSDLGELLRITKPLSERSPNSNKASRMDSTADAAYELDSPPGTSSSPSKINAQGTNHPSDSSVTQPGVVEADSLAKYASQSREDRQTVLDEFMISKLEDPNFAVLCEDLDTCWRKIALGL